MEDSGSEWDKLIESDQPYADILIADDSRIKGRVVVLEIEHAPNLVESAERFETFLIHLACRADTNFITTAGTPGKFQVVVPIPEGKLPYDTSIVAQQFVNSYTPDELKRETINAAGSVIISIRELCEKKQLADQLVILFPGLMAGMPLGCCIKGKMNVTLVHHPDDLEFEKRVDFSHESEGNVQVSICEENMKEISQRVIDYYASAMKLAGDMSHTIPELKDLNAPLFAYFGLLNFPTAFACTAAAQPSVDYWENAAHAAVLRCFPSDSLDKSIAAMNACNERVRLVETAVMTASFFAGNCQYTGDASPIDKRSLEVGNEMVNSMDLSKHHENFSRHHSITSYMHTKRAKLLKAEVNKASGNQPHSWVFYEDFSALGGRALLRKVCGDCEDTAMNCCVFISLLQRAEGLGPVASKLRTAIESQHALFLLMSVRGQKSSVDQGKEPLGGHAAGDLIDESMLCDRFANFSTRLMFGQGKERPQVTPVAAQMVEGTSIVKSNVTDPSRVKDYNNVITFYRKHREELENCFIPLRDAPITAKNEDPFYHGVHQAYNVSEARKGYASPWFGITDSNKRIGAMYKDYIGINGDKASGAFVFPPLTQSNYRLMKSLVRFATPTPKFEAPSEDFLVRSPVKNQELVKICAAANAQKRVAAATHPVVLLLPENMCNARAIAALKKISADPEVISMHVFNNSATDLHRMYQFTLMVKNSD